MERGRYFKEKNTILINIREKYRGINLKIEFFVRIYKEMQ